MKMAIRTFLKSSTANYYGMFTIGTGYLEAWAALNSKDTLLPPQNAASPVETGNVVWGSKVDWPSNVVWGSKVSGSNVVWGLNVAWA